MDEDRERDTEREGGEQTDGEVGVRDGGHAGDGGEQDDKDGDEATALDGGDGGEDEVEDVSAANELVTGDGGIGEKDGNGAEDAGGLVVASFEQVRERELGEVAGSRGDRSKKMRARPAHPPAAVQSAAKPWR